MGSRKNYYTFTKSVISPQGQSHSENCDEKIRLKREIGLLEGTSITIGAIIGSGIFISPKGIVESVSSVGLSLLIWVFSGILSTIGAICYTELGTSFPQNGGDYHYIIEAFGSLPGFLVIWANMMIFVPCNNAILALSFGQYVMQPLFLAECSAVIPDLALRLFAAASICILTYLACHDAGSSAKIQNVFSFVKLAALGLIITTGAIKLVNGTTENFVNMFESSNTDPGSIALAFFSGIYAYGGANTLNSMTEEIKDPNRTLPRSIYIAMLTVIVVYLMTNVAYFTTLTPQQMLDSEAVAVTFADNTLGALSWVISMFVAISTFGGLAISIMQSSSRDLSSVWDSVVCHWPHLIWYIPSLVSNKSQWLDTILFAGARKGHFPLLLSHIQFERRTPIASLIFLCFLSLIYLSTSNVLGLINYAGFVFNLISGGAGAALLYLRWKRPNHIRPVKVHLAYPILYIIICLFLFILPLYVAPMEAAIGCGMTLSGLPIYLLLVKPQQVPSSLRKFLERSTVFVQKLFLSLPTEDEVD